MNHRENTTVLTEPDIYHDPRHRRAITALERSQRFADSDRFGDWLAETGRPVTNRSARQFADERGLMGSAS